MFGRPSLRGGLLSLSKRISLATGLAASVMAVTALGAPTKSLKYYALSSWTTDQGLPQDFVTAIAQTADGFLWVGTMSGLVRFDGVRFQPFPVREGEKNLYQRVAALAPASDGSLWIGTLQGVSHYRQGNFVPIVDGTKPKAFAVDNVVADGETGAWVISHGRLFHADDHAVTVCPLPTDGNPGALQRMAMAPDGVLWIAGNDGVYALHEGRVLRHLGAAEGLPERGVSLIYVDMRGTIYAADGHRLYLLTGDRFVPEPSPGLSDFVSVLTDHAGVLWMASGGLLGISRNVAGQIDVLTTAGGLLSNDARILYEDRDKDIWIGTIAGLQRLHDGIFTTYTEADGLPRAPYDAVYEDGGNDIWVGSLEDGVGRLHDGTVQRYDKTQGLKPGQIRGFADTGDGLMVAVSDYGLFRLEGSRFTDVPGLPQGYVVSPVADDTGTLWFGVNGDGVFHLTHRVLSHYASREGLSGIGVMALLPDGHDGVLAATTDGVARLSEERREDASKAPLQRIADVPAFALRNDARRGGLWLGTSDGIVYVKAGRMTRISQEQGLVNNLVLTLTPDDYGNLWLATANAILRIDREQIDAVLSGRSTKIAAKTFTQADGLKSRDVLPIGQVSMVRAHDGRIWIATAHGLSVADPVSVHTPLIEPIIDSVSIDETWQPIERERTEPPTVNRSPYERVTVPPGRHRLNFVFTAPDLHSAEQVRFRYKLGGWDKTWLDAGPNREISYTGLPPGKYQLIIMAANEEGIWNDRVASLAVSIQPFFYQTKLFLTLAFLTGLGLIIEVSRRRTSYVAENQRLRSQERAAERERIAYEIHDTVIQDMVGTALQLELIGMQIPDHPGNAARLISGLTVRMREMIEKSRGMVSSLHSTATPEYDLLAVLSDAAAEFRLGELPALVLETNGPPRELHPWLRDEVYRICREAIANAFRHSGAKKIEVCVTFHPDEIQVTVRDDGRGMDDDVRIRGRPGHFGLSGMQAHARRIGATVTIESEPDRGTRVLLQVPAASRRRWTAWRRR